MLGRLRAAGYPSVVVVDLRNDDMGLDVVRVVVPGLARDNLSNSTFSNDSA